MTLLEEIKTALRIKAAVFDEGELGPLIEACKLDLRLSGVNQITEDDALVRQAVKLYAKANFGFSEDSGKFANAYEALKNSMALSGDYGGDAGAVPG